MLDFSRMEKDEIEKAYARLFSTDDGWQVLSHLQSIAFMRAYRMMKGDEPGISPKPETTSAETNESDLNAMMRDPRYYRDRDPAFVAKVTEGFKKIYGE